MDNKKFLINGIYVGKPSMYPKRSIKVLTSSLMENEQIMIIIAGNTKLGPGAIALTSRRIIFASKLFFSSRVTLRDYAIKDVSSVQYDTGGRIGASRKLLIMLSKESLEVTAITPDAGQAFANKLREVQYSLKEPSAQQPSGLQDLKILAELKEQGVISEEEFLAKKKSILAI